MLRAVVMLLLVCGQAQAETSIRVDGFGCAIHDRPEDLTFSTFRDAWRSVAADKLYSLMRHRAVIDVGSCSCEVMRPEWSVITPEFERLGFGDGPRSGYDAWVQSGYFPSIETLRDAVVVQCGEVE